jgi:hypothetical protein
MKAFKNLTNFIKYCEQVCNYDDSDEDEFVILAALAQASYLTPEKLIEDVEITLHVYYKFLEEAIDQELYYMAAVIVTAKNCEIEHYINLSNNVLPLDELKESIIQVDKELNQQYLG